MSEWKVGDRVQVVIVDARYWNAGAVTSMNGKVGTVREVKPNYTTGPAVLVEFDEPAESWHSHATPTTSFHFGVREVRRAP